MEMIKPIEKDRVCKYCDRRLTIYHFQYWGPVWTDYCHDCADMMRDYANECDAESEDYE